MPLSSRKHVGVVVNKDYCFDTNEIQLSKKIHEAKEIQRRISNERKWFERRRICRIPSNLSQVPEITRTQFQTMLLDGRNDACADRKHPRLLMSDLAYLVGNQWFSLEVMHFFISLINGSEKTLILRL